MPSAPPPAERLRATPTFALRYALDGRPFVAKEVEPYSELWLSERERVLLSLFPPRRGETVENAVAAYLRLAGGRDTPRRRAALMQAISQMRAAGVLAGETEDTARYDAAMADKYLKHRPIPEAVSEVIVRQGGIGGSTPVLDLAGGPGNLALALARASDFVTLMELSRGFVEAAAGEARRARLSLQTLHESCNRLASHEGTYDVVTVSQALHWLDDVAVCRGVCRILAAGGTFFVVQSALTLADDHPLSFVLGDRTPLGDKAVTPFAAQMSALQRRLAGLFEALDAPDVQRIDPTQAWGAGRAPIGPVGAAFFRQTRPFGEGFARAFLSPAHVAETGMDAEAFWAEVKSRCATASFEAKLGVQDWAVLSFRRGARSFAADLSMLPVHAIDGRGLPSD